MKVRVDTEADTLTLTFSLKEAKDAAEAQKRLVHSCADKDRLGTQREREICWGIFECLAIGVPTIIEQTIDLGGGVLRPTALKGGE